jgi:AAA ATPase domain
MPRFNPFRPGKIVGPAMFAGRLEELRALERILYQISQGNAHHFLVHGERGIGKSSLLLYIQFLATGAIQTLDASRFNLLTVSVELEPSDSYRDLVRKLGAELKRSVDKLKQTRKLASQAWDFLKRWEVMGVKYTSKSEVEPHELVNELADDIQKTIDGSAGLFAGILFLVDEADKPSASASLGELLKILTERLTKRQCERFGVGLAGLSSVIETLRASHESSPRIFDHMLLEPLHVNERTRVVVQGLDEAERKNGFRVDATPEALELISELSEGYPHFIQEFAYHAFDYDSDNRIDEHDVGSGARRENGAFQQLGSKYFHGLYFEKINSEDYREVLRAMAPPLLSGGDGWISKSEIRHQVKLANSTITNAIHALKTRQIIVPKPGRAGVYRLPSRAFAAWIAGYSAAAQRP